MITTINEFKLILEKFVNLWTKESMNEYIDEVYAMMVEIYKPIGGFLTANSPQELINKCDLIKIIKRDGKISAVSCYKVSSAGRKLICGGTNGTDQGKRDLFVIVREDIQQLDRSAHSEVSGKLEHLYLKQGASMIPNYLVSTIIGKEVELDEDGFHYFRTIKGQRVRKVLVGNVNI